MLDQEELIDQMRQLETYRSTLAVYLSQREMLGAAYAAPPVLGGIGEMREQIRAIKVYLREKQIAVEDQPGDEETDDVLDIPIFFQVRDLLRSGDIDVAERKLATVPSSVVQSAGYWYWKARLAAARGNRGVALAYINEALQKEPRHEHSLALKMKLLILCGDQITTAREIAGSSYGISVRLDNWLRCIARQGLLDQGPWSDYDLDTRCPFSTESISEDR
jgi:hypothetical protein